MHRASFGHFRLPALRIRKLRNPRAVNRSPRRQRAGDAAGAAEGRAERAVVLLLPVKRGHQLSPHNTLEASRAPVAPHTSASSLLWADRDGFGTPVLTRTLSDAEPHTQLEAWRVVRAAERDNSK